MRRIKRCAFVSGVVLFIFGMVLFLPRKYDVLDFNKRIGTRYWNLSTGSKIGYTLIECNWKEKKSPIIYLHGGPGGRIKNKTIEFLEPLSSKGHDIYLYDQIGSGHSNRFSNIEKYTVDRHRKDLEAIVKTISKEKVIFIAHSWGAMLAMNFLIENSTKLEKLILFGPGPILPVDQSLVNISSPDSLNLKEPKYSNREGNERAYNLRSKLILKWAHLFKKKLGSDQEVDKFFLHLNSKLNRSTTCKGNLEIEQEAGLGYYSHVMTVHSFKSQKNKKDKLKELKLPVLILRGQCDNQKWGFANEYLKLLPNSKLKIIEDQGHDWHQWNQKKNLRTISDFLKH